MNNVDTLLTHATIITAEETFFGSIAIQNGKVAQVLRGDEVVAAQEVIDCRGLWLLPGLVDSHVHFNEPGRADWEGYEAGTRAAAAGGVTTVLEMPFNATPPTSTARQLQIKRETVRNKCIVDYGHWGGLEPQHFGDLALLYDNGVIAFKAFMCNSGIDFESVNTLALLEGMEVAAHLGAVVGVHAENEEQTSARAARLQGQHRHDPRAWAESRPAEAELEAINRAISIAASVFGAQLHIVHVTVAEGIQAIQRARSRGINVTGETCPHYLALDEDDLARIGPLAKCGPPLRTRERVEALWREVLSDQVHILASDHSPCPVEMKQRGVDNIWQAWGGITGIQTMLPVLLTEGVHRRGLSPNALVHMTSLNPAQRYGLYPRKGHLGIGADADLVLVDPLHEWRLSATQLLSRHQQSPFEGNLFKGIVVRTLVRGVTVYADGAIVMQPGFGRLVMPAERLDVNGQQSLGRNYAHSPD